MSEAEPLPHEAARAWLSERIAAAERGIEDATQNIERATKNRENHILAKAHYEQSLEALGGPLPKRAKTDLPDLED